MRRLAAWAGALLPFWLAWLPWARAEVEYPPVLPGQRIEFPRDEGSHPSFRTEWWYVTGWLDAQGEPPLGFQITFFRIRPGIDERNPSRFAVRQLLLAHAALSDPRRGALLHAEKSARAGFGLAAAAQGGLDVHIDDWFLRKEGERYLAAAASDTFSIELAFDPTQAPLLQGEAGYSRKGPRPESASYYYSLPQLHAAGRIVLDGRERLVRGSAWLDHEWSSSIMDERAQGWDWVGLNLHDGGALMAFRMRDQQGGQHGAAASWRAAPAAGGAIESYPQARIHWSALREWRSPRSGISYPVEWRLRLGERSLILRPLMDDQENDTRRSTGTIYWEGAVRAYDLDGRELGRGYLELTGYGSRLRF